MVTAQASIRTALRNTVLLMAKKEVRMGQGPSKVQPHHLHLGATEKLYRVRTGAKGFSWEACNWAALASEATV